MTDKPEIVHTQPIPLIDVKGTHREIGRQIGEACQAQIQHHLQNTQALIANSYDVLALTWEGAQIQARKYMPFVQEVYPQYAEEMMGIAEGAGLAFDDVAVINALEAVTMDALHLSKCTSMAVNEERTADGHVLVAHNEDWLPEDEEDVYLVRADPDDEPPFLAMTYGALLPNIGFNAYGIAQCCDSVRPADSRIGLPRVVVSRAVLAAHTPDEAIRRVLVPHRAAGYNHLLAHESGELYSVEVSAKSFALLYAQDGLIVHTNHYLDFKMQAVEDEPDQLIDSQVRYFRAMRLLKKTPLHRMETLQAIQRDHVNYPDSICNHAKKTVPPLSEKKTINAMVMDLTERVMHICWGNPCVNKYRAYFLL